MRKITDNDMKGLATALRVTARAGGDGGGFRRKTAEKAVAKALGSGVTVDRLLNPENYRRALESGDGASPELYAERLARGGADVRDLRDEPGWNDPEGDIIRGVAEAAHDFFTEVTGGGGYWNIPTAIANLIKALTAHTLQGILSEELITATGESRSYFKFIKAVADDFGLGRLPVDDSLTDEQESAMAPAAGEAVVTEPLSGGQANGCQEPEPEPAEDIPPFGSEAGTVMDEDPDNEPFPDEIEETSDEFETTVYIKNSPNEFKRSCVADAVGCLTPSELGGLIATIEGGDGLSISQIITSLAEGRFDKNKENPMTRDVHEKINGDLTRNFISCCQLHGVRMDVAEASRYDLLKDSWDLRDTSVRRLAKLKKLIYAYGEDDPDLMDAIADIETLYSGKKE